MVKIGNLSILNTFFFVILILCMPYATFAANISVRPAYPSTENEESQRWFFMTLTNGATQTDTLFLENTGLTSQIIKLYPADTTPTTDEGFALKQRVEPMTEIGAWVTLDESEIVLAPGEQREINFTITTPKHISPGEYAGAIMVEPIEKDALQELQNSGIRFHVRYGTRIYLTITPAPITSFWLFWLTFISIVGVVLRFFYKSRKHHLRRRKMHI